MGRSKETRAWPTPKPPGRKDIVVSVKWVDGAGDFTNWCGARNFSLSLTNETGSNKVGDCDDWSKPALTRRYYSGQDVTATMDATYAKSWHPKVSEWAREQRSLRVRISFPGAAAGDIEYYVGTALLTSLELGGIGNLDGEPVTENVSLEFDGGLEVQIKA